jgi:hypothetical protein
MGYDGILGSDFLKNNRVGIQWEENAIKDLDGK